MAMARVRSISCDSQEWEKIDGKPSSRSGLPRVSANAIAEGERRQSGRERNSLDRSFEDQDARRQYSNTGDVRRPSNSNKTGGGRGRDDEDDFRRPSNMTMPKEDDIRRPSNSNGRGRDDEDDFRRPSNRTMPTEDDIRRPSNSDCRGRDDEDDRRRPSNITMPKEDDLRRPSNSNGRGRDDEEDFRRPSNRTTPKEDDIRRPSNSNRKSLGQGGDNEEGTTWQTRKSTRNSCNDARRPSASAEDQETESDAETELLLENSGWQPISEAFPNGLPEKFREPDNGRRSSRGQDRGSESPPAVGRKSYGQDKHGEGDRRRASNSKTSYKQDAEGGTRRLSHGSQGARRPSARSEYQEPDSDADTQFFVEGRGWQEKSDAFPDRIPDTIRRPSTGTRSSHGQVRHEESDVRRSSGGRKSYGQDQYGENDGRQASNSRKSHDHDGAREGVRRLSTDSQSARRPSARSEYQEPDSDADSEFFVGGRGWQEESDAFPDRIQDTIRRPSTGTRSSHGQVRHEESDVRRPSGGRKSYGQDQYGENDGRWSSNSRKSYDHDDAKEGVRRLSSDSQSARRPSARSEYQGPEPESETEIFLEESGWQKSSDAFRNGIPDTIRRPSKVSRSSHGQINSSDHDSKEGDARRVSRNSFGQSRDEEDRSRRSSAGRKADEESDARRLSRGSNKLADEDSDIRRSSRGGRQSHGQILDNVPGTSTRRLSTRDCSQGEGVRGRSNSRTESRRGSEQRMLSRAPPEQASEYETEIYFEGPGWVAKSSNLRGTLTLCLNADDSRQMASIIWNFSDRGASVKSIGTALPEKGRTFLRPGDELFSISGMEVHKKSRQYVEAKWLEAQKDEMGDIVKLVFLQW